MLRVLLVVLGFALLAVSLVVGLLAYRDAGRLFARDVVFVAPLYYDSALFFSGGEIERFGASFPDYVITAVGMESTVINTQTKHVRATVYYASLAFYSLHFMCIVEGGPPQEHTNSLMLSEILAWRLFGGFNVTGVTVWAFGEPFVVSGVVEGDDLGYIAWLPGSFAPGMPLPSLYIRLPYYNIVDAHVVPREMLGFRDPGEFLILDINRYIKAIGLRNRLALYALWIVGFVWAILGFSRIILQVKNKQPERVEFAKLAFAGCIALLSAYVLLEGIGGVIYALPNLSYANASLLGFIFGWVDMPPAEFISPNLARLFELNTRANLAFFFALAAAALSFGMVNNTKLHFTV